MDTITVGNAGQQYAEGFLKRKGYKFVERNWRSKLGEVDLIFRDNQMVVFVEVKALVKYSPYFQPEDHLTFWKAKKLKQLALAYLNYKNLTDTPYRIDLVAVELDSNLNLLDIRHYPSVIEE